MLDVRKFLTENFGSAQDVQALLTAHTDDPPSLLAVEKWYQRNSVPASYLAALLIILENAKGEAISLVRYGKVRG